MKKTISLLLGLSALFLSSCNKISPIGILVAGTAVEDRVQMSHLFFLNHKLDYSLLIADGEDYTFIVGADSHLTTDPGRMDEMLSIGLKDD